MPQCPECGLGYVPEVPEDRRYHKKFHDTVVNGLRAPSARSDHIIWEEGAHRITVVNFRSPLVQRRRAERIGLLAHKDTPYDFAPYCATEDPDDRNVHLFLGYAADRGIALLLVEKRSTVWRCTWEEFEAHKAQKLPDHPPMWSVGLAWVNRRHRRRGWAHRLAMETARSFGLNVQQLGWYTPFTKAGEAMVRNLCPTAFYIAK